MSLARKLFSLSVVGTLVGGLLAVAQPLTAATAEEGCKCDDSGAGKYKCNVGQTECVAGAQICELKCQD